MNVLRNIVICSCIMLLGSCCGQTKEKAFLTQYEFEDVAQFKSASIYVRGADSEKNPIILVDAPYLIRDTSRVGCYRVILGKKNNQVINAHWTLLRSGCVDADTIKLQKLAQSFRQYKIPRLDVDEKGNVFVFLKDVETLALVRFANEEELQKQSKEKEWINIKHNWYRPR